jgi:uncharacterized protein (TIGR03000 family)
MRKNLWLLGVTGLAVLVASSTANAQRGRGRSWGGSGLYLGNGNGYGYGGVPNYGGYGYRPYSGYTGYRGGFYNQPNYGYSRPIISTPYNSGATTYYSQPLYSSNDTVGQTFDQGTAVASTEQSNYYNPTMPANGMITILVPDEAQVWFGNIPTTVQGSARSFQLPPLDSGRDYTYTIRAKWMENGRERDQTKVVSFRAGQSFTVDMRTAPMTVTNPPLPPQLSR